jgi:hypothetical protein
MDVTATVAIGHLGYGSKLIGGKVTTHDFKSERKKIFLDLAHEAAILEGFVICGHGLGIRLPKC